MFDLHFQIIWTSDPAIHSNLIKDEGEVLEVTKRQRRQAREKSQISAL